MQQLWRDLRFGLRWWAKSPVFFSVAVLTLALGVAGNTAIFSFMDQIVLRSLGGVSRPESLVQLLRTSDGNVSDSLSYPDCLDFQRQSTTFSGLAMTWPTVLQISLGGEAERLNGELATAAYFKVLGVKPLIGRLFATTDESTEGSNPVVVLSSHLWRNRFKRDASVLGKPITLNGLSYTVIGVAAEDFSGVVTGRQADAWIPITMWRQADPDLASSTLTWHTNWFHDRDTTWLQAFGRLKPEISVKRAQADVSTIAGRLAKEYPLTNRKVGVRVAPHLGLPPYVRSRARTFITLPLFVVGIVLLMVCANLTGMMLTKAAGRQREIGIRLAVGANRWHIVRQLLTEGMLLAISGGFLGWFLGIQFSKWISSLLPESYFDVPLAFRPELDSRTFWFTLAIAGVSGVLFSLAPVAHLLELDLLPLLKDQMGSRARIGPLRLREVLIFAQTTFSVILLVVAGLCIQTLQNARQIDTGFSMERVLTAKLDLGRQHYADIQERTFYEYLLERLRVLPGVQAVSLAQNVPLSGFQVVTKIYPEGLAPEPGLPQISYNVVTPDYFRTVGIPLLRGRSFSSQDNEQSPRVAVVNASLAEHFWPGQDPMGKHFRFGNNNSSSPMIEVVGIARNTKVANVFAKSRMYLYLPLAQRHEEQVIVHVLAAGEPDQLISALRREVATLDGSLPVYEVKPFARYLEDALTPQRVAAWLMGIFGMLALTLAAIGLYGQLAYAVQQDTREIGIRMALGAQSSDVLKLVLFRGMRLALSGVAAGLLLSWAVTRVIQDLLFGIKANDPGTFAFICLLLITVSGIACYVPARHASHVDPNCSIRSE